MDIAPKITFKAGICELEETTGHVIPSPEPGYVYLYSEEELMHFCWRPRDALPSEPPLDLIMFPSDGTFTPYTKKQVNGRIFVLKFSSSSQRHLFYLQSKSQASNGDPAFFSPRDLKIGEVVNSLLQGEDVDVAQAVAEMRSGHPPDDEDATMEDVEGYGSGGAGPGATGGDVREEGEDAREGGADGGRATGGNVDAQSIIQNFINSMPGASGRQPARERQFTTLQDLLTASTTVAWVDSASESTVDKLLQYLPPNLPDLAREEYDDSTRPLTLQQKKELLKRVLRSPQFAQSLASLTFALRDGGLPSISEALSIPVQNGGFMRRGGVPLGGGDAVEAFLNGVKEASKDQEDDTDMNSE